MNKIKHVTLCNTKSIELNDTTTYKVIGIFMYDHNYAIMNTGAGLGLVNAKFPITKLPEDCYGRHEAILKVITIANNELQYYKIDVSIKYNIIAINTDNFASGRIIFWDKPHADYADLTKVLATEAFPVADTVNGFKVNRYNTAQYFIVKAVPMIPIIKRLF